MTESNSGPTLAMYGITKIFPGVVACNNVSFEVLPGEVHALLGENGAGKTTLMNILYGIHHPDSGEIYLKGQRVNIRSPRDALSLGIGMVHQHFMLIPRLTVIENIILGSQKRFSLGTRDAEKRIRDLSERYNLRVEPDALVAQLSVGQRQRVEILKALYRGAQSVLILDEPTAWLTHQETQDLFRIIKAIVKGGTSVIFISHKLREVMEISDRVTVLRGGKTIGTVCTSATDPGQLARMMVGREAILRVERSPKERFGDVILEVENLCALNDRGLKALRDVSLKVHQGEILGVAGVAGNGQHELAEVLAGLRKPQKGKILIDGKDLTNASRSKFLQWGIEYVPADRKRVGSVGDFSLKENAILGRHTDPRFSRLGLLKNKVIDQFASRLITEFGVRTPSSDNRARFLSGGNLQRFILARALVHSPKVLIAEQPTAGLDINAIENIHKQLLAIREEGAAVVLISMDLEEILMLSDRIVVIYEGEIIGEFPSREVNVEEIGLLMAGVKRQRTLTQPEIMG